MPAELNNGCVLWSQSFPLVLQSEQSSHATSPLHLRASSVARLWFPLRFLWWKHPVIQFVQHKPQLSKCQGASLGADVASFLLPVTAVMWPVLTRSVLSRRHHYLTKWRGQRGPLCCFVDLSEECWVKKRKFVCQTEELLYYKELFRYHISIAAILSKTWR